eukprot:scaffold158786_cov35-Tisochrysis_lutea.AAC.3
MAVGLTSYRVFLLLPKSDYTIMNLANTCPWWTGPRMTSDTRFSSDTALTTGEVHLNVVQYDVEHPFRLLTRCATGGHISAFVDAWASWIQAGKERLVDALTALVDVVRASSALPEGLRTLFTLRM